jgi:hypothetical protein
MTTEQPITAIRVHALKQGDVFIMYQREHVVTNIDKTLITYTSRSEWAFDTMGRRSRQWVELVSPFNVIQSRHIKSIVRR